MKQRIVWNDIKANKLLSFSTSFFMALVAFLFALTCFLSMNLLGSIEVLMEKAQTPDFLQMHTGELQEDLLKEFAKENQKVKNYQTVGFLNLENASIELNGTSLADSTQDNGVCVQSEWFDYLLDLENQIIEVQWGEIYVPICYKQEYKLHIGEKAQIGKMNFIIAGFLRDSQMNSMMASSKRFLVNEADYKKLKAVGEEEYLIEFQLKEGADANQFATEYADQGLYNNGPTITRSLIKMMNALSDGMMILVFLLVSIVMLLIAMLCVRYMVLTKLETDQTEIGMLKTIGIRAKEIRKLYFVKYMVLSLIGAIVGLLVAFMIKTPLQQGMQELYGVAENGSIAFVAAAIGAVVTELFILLSISSTLKRMEGMTAVEALTGRKEEKRKPVLSKKYLLIILVIVAGVFLMVVPQNIYSTISSPKFVTYMGIGNGEIRLDLRQMDSIQTQTEQAEKLIANNDQVRNYVSLQTKGYRALLPDGSYTKLNVELGDHTVYPVSYTEGKEPVLEDEIALSSLCAEEFGVRTGDTITLVLEDKKQEVRICGIYSDITNGGKTAKAAFTDENTSAMWSILYVTLQPNASKIQWMTEMEHSLAKEEISARVTDIKSYVTATYGQTMKQVETASKVATLLSIFVIMIVVFLFFRLDMAKDRMDISFQKAIGLTSAEIQWRYIRTYLLIGGIGVAAGILLGNVLGERIASLLMHALGATGVQFIVDEVSTYLLLPVIGIGSVGIAVLMGASQIKKIKAFECCSGRE